MTTKIFIPGCLGFLIILLLQSCCKNVACDAPPNPKIILIANLDSLGNGLNSAELNSIFILKRSVNQGQVDIDTLDNNYWYYSRYSDYPDYPNYDLELGNIEGDQYYDYLIGNDFGLEIIIDEISLNFRMTDSRCCSFRVLSLMGFDIDNSRTTTTQFFYDLIIEK